MTAPMPNPFLSEIPRAGSPAPSVSLGSPEAGGVPAFKLDERAFMAALLSNSVVAESYRGAPAHVGQPSKGVSSLDLAAVPSGAAALSGPDINARNIATLLALAESDTASAETSSTLAKA